MVKKESQRYSLRKSSLGVASVLLGTAVLAVGVSNASADEVATAPAPKTAIGCAFNSSMFTVIANSLSTFYMKSLTQFRESRYYVFSIIRDKFCLQQKTFYGVLIQKQEQANPQLNLLWLDAIR